MKRFLVIALVSISAGLVISAVALRYFLRSERVARQVETQLQALYGGPVRVQEVEVGLGSTSLSGFELFEEGNDDKQSDAWLKVATLSTDVPWWDLITGDVMPRKLEVKGARLVLRFDREGRLLTRFPGQTALADTPSAKPSFIPEIALTESVVTFRKDGFAELVVKNVVGRLAGEKGQWVLTGTGDNTELGKLVLQGSISKEFQEMTIRLRNEAKVHVTQSVLDRMPFVPARVWKEIQIEGDTRAELTVSYDLNQQHLHYRVALEPENAKLFIPAIDLAAHQASGKVAITDNLVQIHNVQGQAFGGHFRVEADLDFRGEASKLKFSKIEVENLNVNELPAEWNIPALIRKSIAEGKLFGSAMVESTIRPGTPTPLDIATLVPMAGMSPCIGSSEWLPSTSLLAAFPIYTVQTRSKGKGQVRDPSGKTEPIEFDWQLAPPRSRFSKNNAQTNQKNIETKIQVVEEKSSADAPSVEDSLTSQLLICLSTFMFVQDLKEKPKASPNYLDMNLSMKNINLAEVIKNLDIKIPFSVEGKVSFQIKVSIPTDRADDFKAYKIDGSAETAQLVLAGVTMADVRTELHYEGGVLQLKSLKGRVPGELVSEKGSEGSFVGTGQLQVIPLGELRADLQLDRIPVRRLAGLGTDMVEGAFSGKLNLRAPGQKLNRIDSLEGSGNITSERLKVYGLRLEQISSSLRLKDGVLTLPDAKVQFEGAPVAASAELRLSGAYPFLVKTDLRSLNLAALQNLTIKDKASVPSLAGAFTTSIALRGKLSPLEVVASGDAKAQNLKVDTVEAQDVAFRWETNGAKLDLKNVEAMLYRGKVTGSAVLPLDPKLLGSVDLRIHDIDVKQLAKDLRVPFRIEGSVNGSVKGKLPPVAENTLRTGTFHLDLNAPKMRVQNVPTEQLRGNIEYRKGVFDYKIEGKTLGGTFDLEGQVPSRGKADDLKKDSKKGRLTIRNIDVARLFQALKLQNSKILSGVLNLEVHYIHEAGDWIPAGRGVMRVSNLFWKDTLVANNLQGDVFLTDQQFRLRNLEGSIAQGTFRTQVTFNFVNPQRSWFTLNLDRVEASQLLDPWPDVKIEGPLQGRIRGSLGGIWRGTADFEMSRGKVFGLEVMQWRLPITWTYSPVEGRGQLEVHETSAQLARGRAIGRLNLSWDYSARLEGSLRLVNADLQDFLRQMIGPNQIGGGRLSARFDFSGNEVRSLRNINGDLTAAFNQAQPLQIPVLRQIAPFLGVGPSTSFQNGNLLAYLDRGILRIRQLNLQGNTIQLFMDGTVSLEGRLNLSAVAKTGDVGLPSARPVPISLRIPVAGPVPIALLVEASNLLSNRLIYLQITGTVNNPVIQPRPVPILTQEAIRYFLNRNLPITINP